MNTNALKRFAQQTRTLLLEQVATRLHLVLKTDSVELRERAEQVAALRTVLQTTTAAELVDKVAYTWFNRLVALRYLDVNGYQPLGVRIVSPAETDESHPLPEVLQLAQQGMIDAELLPDQARVMGLLRGAIPSQNVDNEVYRELLVGACNSLHTLFPFLFEPLQDHTELLLPADLTTMYSVVYKVRNELLVEDCQHVEVLGWLYQFYIAERKDAVFAAKTKVKKEDIPAATQLFTPRWIVEYMVQNTVGKLWLQHHPDSGLRQHMPYFIESTSLQASEKMPLNGPEELTVLDPACGSGHLLIYAFELLAHIYEEEAYSKADIPGLILTHNLRGLEIDERAAQLAGFALMMKARSYHNRAFRKELTPHITHLKPLALRKEQAQAVLAQAGHQGSLELWHDLDALRQVDNIGSLLVPHTPLKELLQLKKLMSTPAATADMFQTNERENLVWGLTTLIELSEKYACVAANPPYMGSGNMNAELTAFVKKNYPDSKADLMACFMESSVAMLKKSGYLGMINGHSWMFLSSYERMREKLIKEIFIDTLLHLGPRAFPEIGGEVVQNAAFTFFNHKEAKNGTYVRLVDFSSSDEKESVFLDTVNDKASDLYYDFNQKHFIKIPGSPIGYWATATEANNFTHEKIGDFYEPRVGMATADNDRFTREWYEVNHSSVGLGYFDRSEALLSKRKWFPFTMGGSYRKWYGNNTSVVNWFNDGAEIRNFKNAEGKLRSHNYNLDFIFKEALTWTVIGSDTTSFRYTPKGSLFSNAGYGLWATDGYELQGALGLLNSNIAKKYLAILSPTIQFESGYIRKVPILKFPKAEIVNVNKLIEIAKKDWDDLEISVDFTGIELLKGVVDNSLQRTFNNFESLLIKRILENINLELALEKNISDIHKSEASTSISGCSLYKEIVSVSEVEGYDYQVTVNKKAIVERLLSYVVGCIFGRFSLDKEGFILAGQNKNLSDYLLEVGKEEADVLFLPDRDNIVPVLDDEWFDDDIVARVVDFLKVVFGENNYAQNIAFIEEGLGKSIRQYFTKDFYTDHIRKYSKRHIYWQFSSPNRAFCALIYLHRYTPDTLNLLLNRYLRPLQVKVQERIERLKFAQISSDSSSAERSRAIKEQDKLEQQLRELQVYERDVMLPLATARINLNLDEGVLVNYNKFGKAVREITGLNDAKTKAKVRAFDWIDATQIR